MKYLIEVTENYRVDSEKEAAALIEEAKQNQRQYSLSKYSSVQKERKSKGEVVDSWYRVSLTKKFTDEKEPYVSVVPTYESTGCFPDAEEEREDNEDED